MSRRGSSLLERVRGGDVSRRMLDLATMASNADPHKNEKGEYRAVWDWQHEFLVATIIECVYRAAYAVLTGTPEQRRINAMRMALRGYEEIKGQNGSADAHDGRNSGAGASSSS